MFVLFEEPVSMMEFNFAKNGFLVGVIFKNNLFQINWKFDEKCEKIIKINIKPYNASALLKLKLDLFSRGRHIFLTFIVKPGLIFESIYF